MTNKRDINLKELPSLWPSNICWSELFNNDNPVDLEIGCGRPHFFFDRSINYANRNIVGVEWKYEFVKQAQKRIVREKVNNALALHGNAWSLVPMLFSEKSISYVFINFPDPWWKNRHKKRLLLNDIFLQALMERLKDDGAIVIQTDVSDLFDYYSSLLLNLGYFKKLKLTNEQIMDITKAKTHREKKCLELGQPIYRAVFVLSNRFL